MLSDNLVELPPKENYSTIDEDCLFIGTKIKNRYDEERICIKDTFEPGRYKVDGIDFLLYGLKKNISPEYKKLVNSLKLQKIYDLIGYSVALQDFSLSCNDCYFNLRPPLYPIDNHHIKKCLPEFNYEDFVCFNPEIPKFQAFTSLNVFFITVA
jgi:hypothetical protein